MAGFHGARDIESTIIYVRSGLIGAATAMNLFRGSVQQDAREIVSGVVKKKTGGVRVSQNSFVRRLLLLWLLSLREIRRPIVIRVSLYRENFFARERFLYGG